MNFWLILVSQYLLSPQAHPVIIFHVSKGIFEMNIYKCWQNSKVGYLAYIRAIIKVKSSVTASLHWQSNCKSETISYPRENGRNYFHL